ncbi:hypothetical protein BB559_002868 [Furculomyces boomerangus]|uniref:Uncharacterized protein n=2 Tax=Harpellales TaxID=61421 RepID=A0A2T9YRV4_9FUNG|nr:hypothetical protein BB559_002868 [Furculomyces boomerangus]PVZ98478.1 hypothetical protein BB558_005521 [Smittium angustum]
MEYIFSMVNPSDASSRIKDQLEWSPSQLVFKRVNKIFDPHDVDPFASSRNKQIETFVSLEADSRAVKINALAQLHSKKKILQARALGFAIAAMSGANLKDILTQGLWSSQRIFDNTTIFSGDSEDTSIVFQSKVQ